MKLKLNSIDKDFANIDIELQIFETKKTKVKVRATNHAAVIISEHTITEMRMIIKVLDNYDILNFAKEMFKANKTLNSIKVIN
jgi:3-dehydroquinate dehydratase